MCFEMLETLNDDCQLLIISYLPLKVQLILWEATKDLPIRLNTNIMYAWQHQRSHFLEWEVLEEFDRNVELMNAFLNCISLKVQQLELEYITLELLKRWMIYTFPSVEVLKYTLDDRDVEKNDDVALMLIVKLFPNLVSVKTCGYQFDCKHITKWTQLRQLDFGESWSLDETAKCLGECQMLEDIINCPVTSDDVYDTIMRLPKLRTLSFDGTEDIIIKIVEQRGRDILQITFHDCIYHHELKLLEKMKSLRQLTLYEDDGFKVNQLQSLVSALPLLEQLNLVDTQFWRSELDLWQTVSCCPSLKVLYISGMQFYADFFDVSRQKMLDTLRKRPEPLTLHCHKTGDNEQLIRQHFKHANLKVSFEPLEVDLIEDNYILIKFKPLVD